MLLDSVFYNNIIEVFDSCMDRIFGCDIEKIENIRSFEHMGTFTLRYKYFPHNYIIEIENELRTFDIRIIDDEQASNSLRRITKIKGCLDEEDIEKAISVLKIVLLKNDFDMYLYKNGRMYRKNAEGIKRIKDLKEILNG